MSKWDDQNGIVVVTRHVGSCFIGLFGIRLGLVFGSNRLAYEYMALDIMWYTIKYTHYHTALVWHHYLPLRLTINKQTTKQKLDGN